MDIQRFSFPTAIHFGPGARRRVAELLDDWGMKRPLIVTDRDIAQLPIFSDLDELLRAAGLDVGVFADMGGNPVKSHVTEGVAAYRSHHADSIVAFGGGAALDVAKAIGLMVNHPGDLFDYEDGKPDARPVDQPLPLLIAVPTTAGTGSEVGRSSVVSDDITHAKKIIFDPKMMPTAAVVDPELTVGLPKGITAATGLDALTHNVEAFLAKGYNPLCDGIALEGVRLVARSLPKVMENPKDVAARGDMLAASLMGAVAFQKGLGVTHSLAHPLSTVCDLHHGLGNGIMLPFAMAFNAEAVPDRLARLAAAAGAKTHDAKGFIAWIRELNAKVGIPARLSEVGVKAEHIDALVKFAVADVCHPSNPRPVTAEDFRRLYTEAL